MFERESVSNAFGDNVTQIGGGIGNECADRNRPHHLWTGTTKWKQEIREQK